MKTQYIESQSQSGLYRWFSLQYPKYRYLFIHIRNEGKRSKAEGALAKAMGMQKGVCDIFLAIPRERYPGFFIELKDKGKEPTEEQYAMHYYLEQQGYKVKWYDDWLNAVRDIREYMESYRCNCECDCTYK